MTMPSPQTPKMRDDQPVFQPVYTGTVGSLFGICYSNLFLKIITLFIYSFWARTKMRRYYWSHIKLMDEAFAYLGNGMELFKSYLKFSFLYILPAVIAIQVFEFVMGKIGHHMLGAVIGQLVFVGGILTLFFYAKYSGMRYRLGRTTWRGIRFELRGDPWAYFRLKLKNFFLNLITLGLYGARADMKAMNYVLNNIYYGNIAFTYRGQPDELKKTYFRCWLLIIPTIGISMLWYRAKYFAHIAKFTRYQNLQFRIPVTGGELFWLLLSNVLIFMFTFGLAFPYLHHRNVKFVIKRIKLRGALDFDKILQAERSRGTEGAELHFDGDDLSFGGAFAL